jgi:hypothetical protein
MPAILQVAPASPRGSRPIPSWFRLSLVTCTNGRPTASAVNRRPRPYRPDPRGPASGGGKVEGNLDASTSSVRPIISLRGPLPAPQPSSGAANRPHRRRHARQWWRSPPASGCPGPRDAVALPLPASVPLDDRGRRTLFFVGRPCEPFDQRSGMSERAPSLADQDAPGWAAGVGPWTAWCSRSKSSSTASGSRGLAK